MDDGAGSITVDGAVSVTNFPATQPVSAAALPLPAGASTEATLALIKAKTDNLDVALSTRTKPADTQKVEGVAGGVAVPTSTKAGTAALSSVKVDTAAAGDLALVAGVAGQTVRLYRIVLVASGAVNLKFKDGATDLTGAMALQANGTIILDFDGEPWFTTSVAAALNLNLSAAVQVSGRAYYLQS